jgi:ribosome-associated protein
MPGTVRDRDFQSEWSISASRSSGAGGQNINKVNTKIELRFSVSKSALLSKQEKELLMSRLTGKITRQGELILTAENERSQLKNKKQAIERFYALLEWGLRSVKKRIPTKPSKIYKEKRLEKKRKHAEKKSRRRWDI